MRNDPTELVAPAPPWLQPTAAYVHVPFCAHHCGYCDFAVVTGADDRIGAYLDALSRELATLETPRPVATIFLGGGTPTYLAPRDLERLLTLVRKWLPLNPGGEWSVESTPDSLDADRVAVLADAGVTRVSIGVQSFREPLLRVLERRHTVRDIAPALERVRQRIPAASLDLIFGVPGQTLDDWTSDLDTAVGFAPSHLSCYGLTFEKGTRLWKQWQAGETNPIDEELERTLFLFAHDELPGRGYEHYEVSNYATPGGRCRHNETYWANHAHYGFGLGAARYIDGRRELNTRSLPEYLSRVVAGRSATIQSEELEGEERAKETFSVQLRRAEGVNRPRFVEQTGYELDDLAGETIHRLVELDLLADDGDCVRLTRAGLCVADGVITELWASEPRRVALPMV